MDLEAITIVSGAVSSIVGWLKNAVPDAHRDDKGIVFKRKGKKPVHIKDAFIWPLLTGLIGAGLFAALNWNLLGIGDELTGQLVSGITVGGSGGAAWYHGAKTIRVGVDKLQGKEKPCTPTEEPKDGET